MLKPAECCSPWAARLLVMEYSIDIYFIISSFSDAVG